MQRNYVKNIVAIDYHRNGICGAPFYAIVFDSTEGRRMVATVFDEPCTVAVLDIGLLSEGNVEFGVNSWRGDVYEGQLREAIVAYNEALQAKWAKEEEAEE